MNDIASEPLKWRDALALKVRTDCKAPVITNYQLAVELVSLMSKDEYAGRPLKKPNRPVDRRMFYEGRAALLKRAVLVPDKSQPNTILRFPERKDADPAEVLCAVDPFGFMAYLSAMAFHGLTNRLPKVLYVLTPDPKTWSRMAADKMSRDLGNLESEFREQQLPDLRHTKLEKLSGMVVELLRTKDLGGWRNFRDGAIRVTTIGRTFLHMLQRPDLCGGIRHVMEVFEEHAKLNLNAIVTEFSQHGTKIDRVRAGYILEERCGIEDPRVSEWVRDAARGGSRKLDAHADYAPTFSEKWCLSINV